VGGVRERTDERRSRRKLPSSFDAAVKGIPALGTASLFAGRRSNEGLGRSVVLDAGFLPLSRGAPMTADVRRSPRRGTSSARATKREAAFDGKPSRVRDTSFARSFDPFTSSSRNIAGASSGGEAFARASRSGKSAQAGGTDTGVFEDGRCAARRTSPTLAREPA